MNSLFTTEIKNSYSYFCTRLLVFCLTAENEHGFTIVDCARIKEYCTRLSTRAHPKQMAFHRHGKNLEGHRGILGSLLRIHSLVDNHREIVVVLPT